MVRKKDTKELCMDFLICCYFGQSKNLVKAAIDRAYIDMAAHTLKGFKYDKIKWECRFNASMVICNSLLTYSSIKEDFDSWHNKVVDEIKNCYTLIKLEEGQAQKWLNMTIKYLFVFRNLLDVNDKRLKGVKIFFDNTNEEEYKIPIDSYVLKENGVKDISWSTYDKPRYQEISNKLGDEKDFIWELECWESLKAKYDNPEKDSYACFWLEKRKKTGKKHNLYLEV